MGSVRALCSSVYTVYIFCSLIRYSSYYDVFTIILCVYILHIKMPLAEIITSYHDELKSCTKGYATMSFKDIGHRKGDLVKLDVAFNDELVPAMASIVPREQARGAGLKICEKLKELIPRKQFQVS